jgi:hypothetical protein
MSSRTTALATVLEALTPAQRAELLKRNPHLVPHFARAQRRGTLATATAVRDGDVVTLDAPGLRLDCTPNSRCHRRETGKRRARERRIAGDALRTTTPPPGPAWEVSLERSGPRLLDTDNLAASLKGLRDEVAAFLGVDDGPAAPVAWRVSQRRGGYGARAVIRTAAAPSCDCSGA